MFSKREREDSSKMRESKGLKQRGFARRKREKGLKLEEFCEEKDGTCERELHRDHLQCGTSSSGETADVASIHSLPINSTYRCLLPIKELLTIVLFACSIHPLIIVEALSD